jgi:hypothetical protein
MTWSVRHLGPDPGVVEMTLSGEVGRAELDAAFAGTLASALEHDAWHLLCDILDITGGPTLFDVYAVVVALDQLGVQDRFREALLTRSDTDEITNARFWETACVNRGIAARAFTDRAEALAWLTRP